MSECKLVFRAQTIELNDSSMVITLNTGDCIKLPRKNTLYSTSLNDLCLMRGSNVGNVMVTLTLSPVRFWDQNTVSVSIDEIGPYNPPTTIHLMP